ncbi:hypothetical protein MNL76_06160 [Fervidobacterium riparium]|uniref:Uncharacterized protein n=1 Tax=Fervidobacterium gondwanense DSM 13020 TaxID=1121883 RepID=A0A1M7SUM8_FERGO|nr:hypothetical protein [Fervidobacterium gondwanense]SHN62267.1 hypothetical protein SAMN02745226_01263 [Fervidobacterium gondwanense DSM 13020]
MDFKPYRVSKKTPIHSSFKITIVIVLFVLVSTIGFSDDGELFYGERFIKSLQPWVSGLYSSVSFNLWNLSLVYEDSKLAVGLRLHDENIRTESYKLGFITAKRTVDKSYFDLLTFVGQTYGVALTLGYENYSIPSTGFERTYYISQNQVIQTEYSKTWFSLPSIPFGEGTIGPFSLNYEGFSLSKMGINQPSINIRRGFAGIDSLQLSYVQLGSIHSLGFYVFADKSLEQGVTANLGWDFEEGRPVGILGGRIFIDFQDFRFFFAAYGTYVPSSESIKYGIWMRFLSPVSGDLIIQNNVAYFRFKFSD